MNPKLQKIYDMVSEYLVLTDKDVIKMLCAFVLACRMPIRPPWIFIVSGSSSGKTELMKLIESVHGYTAVDDMTGNTLMSGMKKFDGSPSLLDQIPLNGGFLAFSDFTVMLSKNKEELSKIMSQLRVVFDGKFTKRTGGQVDKGVWQGKAGLIAGATTILYSKTSEFAEMGQRMMIYHLPQEDNEEVGRFKFTFSKQNRPKLLLELQQAIIEYIESIKLPLTTEELPDFDQQTQDDIIAVANLAVKARSPVPRNQYDRMRKQTSHEDPEGIGRLQDQLMNFSHGLMVQNEGWHIVDRDRKLIYKFALDSIEPIKRKVLQMLTTFSYGGDLDQIADGVRLHKDVALPAVDDLYQLGMIEKSKQFYGGGGSKIIYKIVDKYGSVMKKFEGIEVKEEAMAEVETEDDPFSSGY